MRVVSELIDFMTDNIESNIILSHVILYLSNYTLISLFVTFSLRVLTRGGSAKFTEYSVLADTFRTMCFAAL